MVCSRVLMVEGEVEVAGFVWRVVSDLKKMSEYKVIITYLRHTYLLCPVAFAEARRCERGRK
jgi:hypothetical protein